MLIRRVFAKVKRPSSASTNHDDTLYTSQMTKETLDEHNELVEGAKSSLKSSDMSSRCSLGIGKIFVLIHNDRDLLTIIAPCLKHTMLPVGNTLSRA
jgi:hypothetical protein